MITAVTQLSIVSGDVSFLSIVANLSEGLSDFTPCQPTQQASWGFIFPDESIGANMARVGSYIVMMIQHETRKVPGDALQRRVAEMAQKIEQATGRKPGKKQRGELKDAAMLELLPRAFSKIGRIPVLIDTSAGHIYIGTTSASKLDEAITLLVRSIDGLSLSLTHTAVSPAAAMGGWLLDPESMPHEFSAGLGCKLVRSGDAGKESISYANISLDRDEIADQVRAGFVVDRMDVRHQLASFCLTANGTITKIDVNAPACDKSAADEFQADAFLDATAIATIFSDLSAVLGGKVKPGQPESDAA